MEENRNYIYLNNAATSWPKPDCTAKAVSDALLAQPGAMHRGGLDSFDVFDEVRKELAPLLGVSESEQIALGCNATWGLNLALFGFPYQKAYAQHLSASEFPQSGTALFSDDAVRNASVFPTASDPRNHVPNTAVRPVVVTTKAEHNSVLRPLYELEQRGIIQVIYLDTDLVGRVPLSVWEKAMQTYRPVLTVFTHASNVTGAVHDAAAMTAAAKAVGSYVLIDASQTLGWIDLHAETWSADMVAFTGHKYLLGPQGTGGLWVRKGLALQPHLVGGTGIRSDLDTMPEEMPLHLEAGTGNEPSYHGLLAALLWSRKHPADQISVPELTEYLRDGLIRAGADVIVPEGTCTPVVSFTVPGESTADVGFILQESYDIICRTGLHCAPRLFSCLTVPETVRLSLSRFTTKEELDTVISAVEDIIG